jgi:hypothetical protein
MHSMADFDGKVFEFIASDIFLGVCEFKAVSVMESDRIDDWLGNICMIEECQQYNGYEGHASEEVCHEVGSEAAHFRG